MKKSYNEKDYVTQVSKSKGESSAKGAGKLSAFESVAKSGSLGFISFK